MINIPKLKYRHKTDNHLVGFELLKLEKLFQSSLQDNHNPTIVHRLDFFAILVLEEGNLEHTIDFEKINLKQGDCVIISKGRTHSFAPNPRCKGSVIVFTEEFLHHHLTTQAISKIQSLYNYFVFQSQFYQPNLNQEFTQAVSKEFNGVPYEGKADIIGALLTIFLLRMEKNLTKHQNEQGSKLYLHFLTFKNLLENNYPQTRDAKKYAEHLGISYKHLNEICKAFLNKTAKAFIDEYVLLESKRFLASTNLSSKEIAYKCGFDEPTNFQKFFKKNSSLTPIEFRKNIAR